MKAQAFFILLFVFFHDLKAGGEPSGNQTRLKTEPFQCSRLPEQAEAPEVKARLHCLENPGPLALLSESFELLRPAEYTEDGSWGLFVWISPNESPRIPPSWEHVLARHKLLCIGANNAGNKRDILDRIRLAVCANIEMQERFKIDPNRIYVAGFSGGGRVASMLGIAYADLFSGVISIMGVNFYTDLPSADGKKVFPPQFIPDREVLEIAKRSTAFVLVTGEKDFNRAETKIVLELGFKKERFTACNFMEIPGTGHVMPEAQWLEQALKLVERRPRDSGSRRP
ncbi:MAG: Poly(3-hydroxybutyrate) depolymerase [Verrucomicrobia bacterium]|nr:MAG: Poly(3-hydroxybutyrate) depolymerase [Verrucomicrobiota bacterium]